MLAGATGTALAQQLPAQLPSGAEPRPEAPRPVMPLPSVPGGAVTVPKAPAAEAPAGAENYRLTLRDVTIEGATAYSQDSLRATYQDMLGREVSVADLFKIANDIEFRYRNDGFITSRVIVPAQTIEDGTFRLQVVEGFVSDITYPDDIGPALAAVKRLVEPLRGVKPINVAEVERRLLLANDLAGLTVRASLEPSPDTLGASVVVVKTDRKAVDALVSFSNRNTPYLGTAQTTATAALNSFGPNADTVNLSGRVSSPASRAWSVGAGYQALVTGDGLTFSATGSYSKSRPGLTLDPLDVESWVAAGVGTLSYPVIRSRLENLRAVGEFEYRDVNTDISGDRFNRDRLRILRGGFSYDRTDNWDGITAVRGLVHQGLDILDATKLGSAYASRERGRSDFTKLTADITRVQQLPANFSILATATMQAAGTPLLASEQIALGGPSYGRAFDEGEISGDSGWAGSLELRYTPVLPENAFAQGVQIYGFVDGGEVWNRSSLEQNSRNSLVSVGGGVRAGLVERLFATLEIDKPLTRRVATEGDKDMRVFFNITAQY
ncbi:BamA/TamA family outer membrane protein [Azospirillum brasilense]|nr:BamA/TamA family outer membrane protein [Azospirillum brasilense]